MGAKRDFLAEIEEIRGRTFAPEWDNGIAMLCSLSTRAAGLEEESEQQSYFLVASIAAIEAYFKWQIQALIDSGDQKYVNNLRLDDLSIKVSHDLAVALYGKRVTVGELVAHSVGLSSIKSIDKIMSQLLQTNFISLVETARDPQLRYEQGNDAPTIICDADDTIAHVKRTFELRHIICHEAHLNAPVKLVEIKTLCSSCYKFVLASYYGIAYHRSPSAPLNLKAASISANEKVLSLKSEIKTVEDQFAKGLTHRERETFNAMQRTWRLCVDGSVQYLSHFLISRLIQEGCWFLVVLLLAPMGARSKTTKNQQPS